MDQSGCFPAAFIAGDRDWGLHQSPGALEKMQKSACTNMKEIYMVEGDLIIGDLVLANIPLLTEYELSHAFKRVVHIEGDRFPLGELDGSTTERITKITEAFTKAGLSAAREAAALELLGA